MDDHGKSWVVSERFSRGSAELRETIDHTFKGIGLWLSTYESITNLKNFMTTETTTPLERFLTPPPEIPIGSVIDYSWFHHFHIVFLWLILSQDPSPEVGGSAKSHWISKCK